jgi:DNA repair protein RadD
VTPTTAVALRPYQRDAVDAAITWHATHTGHCLIVVPTGGGKSLIMGTLAAEAVALGARVLILAHRGELVAQNVAAAAKCVSLFDIGVVSGAVKQHDRAVTVATIQTFGRRPYEYGAYDLVLVDEGHLIPHGDDGLYHKAFAALTTMRPNMRVIGLTATPYRLTSGRLDKGPGALFTEIAYECDLLQLLADGYLCPLRSLAGKAAYDVAGISTRGGEYLPGALEARLDAPEATAAIVRETITLAADRHKWLVFAAGVEHAEHLASAFTEAGIPTAAVHGTLSASDRAERMDGFRAGRYRALTNCDLLTTGFDAPEIDALVICRPTLSPGLHVQMLGRGLRIHPSKTECLVLDYAGNCVRHGPLDAIVPPGEKRKTDREGEAPAKACPQCQEIVPAGLLVCGCGHQFPPPEPAKLFTSASGAPAISTEPVAPQWQPVTSVDYAHHEPRDPNKPATLRVDYRYHYRVIASEWICVGHDGFARRKAERWWHTRSPETCPTTVEAALALAADLRVPEAIALVPDGKYQRITDYQFPALVTATSSLPRACWSCDHWSDVRTLCQLFAEAPPLEVQSVGCEHWADADPLPF